MSTAPAKDRLARLSATAMRWLRRATRSFFGFATWGPSRTRLRQRLLVWPAPVMALLLLLSWKSWQVVQYGDQAVEDHILKQDLAMRADIEALRAASLTDSWRVHFLEASQLLIASTNPPLDAVDRELVAALAGAPAEDTCGIRIDLVGVRELWGDQAMAKGQFTPAVQRLREALDFAERAPVGCFQGTQEPNPGFRTWLEQTKDRLNLKTKLIQEGKLVYQNGVYSYPVGDGAGGFGYPGDDQMSKACADLPDDAAKAQCIRDNKNLPPKPAPEPQQGPDQPAPPEQPPAPEPTPAPEQPPAPEQKPSEAPQQPKPDPAPPQAPPQQDGGSQPGIQADPDLTGSSEAMSLGRGSPKEKLKKLLQAYRANRSDPESVPAK